MQSHTSPRFWEFIYLRDLWLSGFCSEDISRFLDSTPTALWWPLKRSLQLLECLHNYTVQCSKSVDRDSQFFEGESSGPCEIEKEMWESQNHCGFMQIDFNPETGERVGVAVNAHQAKMWNMSKKQLSTRLLGRLMPLMIPYMDLLSVLIDEILHEFGDKTRFHRIYTSLKSPRNAVLVHHSVTRRFNSDGQVYMVTNFSSVLLSSGIVTLSTGQASFPHSRPRTI